MANQVHALLAVQPANISDDRLEPIAQPEPLAQRSLVVVLEIQRIDRIAARDKGIDLWVPRLVIDAVEDSAELASMDPERLS